LIAFQVTDAASWVEKIGLPAAIILLFMVGGGWMLKFILTYFTGRLDKKDEQIRADQTESKAQLIRLIESAYTTMGRLEKLMEAHVAGQGQILERLNELNRERSGH